MNGLHFVDLSPAEYDRWRSRTVREFAEEHVRFGDWGQEESLARAEAEFQKLIPQGVKTPGHYLFGLKLPDRSDVVGVVWFYAENSPNGSRAAGAFVYDLLVYEPFRGKGYGAQGMRLMETRLRELGIDSVSLQVLGHNRIAIALYEKLGYVATNLRMAKKLSPAE